MIVMHDAAVENVNDYCLPRSSIGRCWNYTELCSNGHESSLEGGAPSKCFGLSPFDDPGQHTSEINGESGGLEKRNPMFVFLRKLHTNGKKFSTYLRKALLQGLKLRLFISSKVLESKAATKAIKIQGIIKRTIISLKRESK